MSEVSKSSPERRLNLVSKFRMGSPRSSISAIRARSLGPMAREQFIDVPADLVVGGCPGQLLGCRVPARHTVVGVDRKDRVSRSDATIAARRRRSTSSVLRSSPSCSASARATSTSARSSGGGGPSKSSRTAITSPSATIGNASAVLSPSLRAAPARGGVVAGDLVDPDRVAGRDGASGQRVVAGAIELGGRLPEDAVAAGFLAVPDTRRLEPARLGPRPEVAERPPRRGGRRGRASVRGGARPSLSSRLRARRARRAVRPRSGRAGAGSRPQAGVPRSSHARASTRLMSRTPIAVQKTASSTGDDRRDAEAVPQSLVARLDLRTGLRDRGFGGLVCGRDVESALVLGDAGRLGSEQARARRTRGDGSRRSAGATPASRARRSRIEALDLCDLLRMVGGGGADVGGCPLRLRGAATEASYSSFSLSSSRSRSRSATRTAAHPLIRASEQDGCERPHDQCHREDEDVRGPEPAAKKAHVFSVGRFRG